ncbi:MAG TPA: hypothetical protein VE982_06185 [Gaiellaceae bacterium]|nr:hypothetical protein [Gaiellaceae bacterium]
MRRALAAELALLAVVLAAQAFLLARLLHNATSYDEDVYLAAVDALRHGQALGTQVFAAQFPGFYDLLRGLSYVTGLGVAALRSGLLGVTVAGTVGGWLVGRRVGGATGGLLVASLLVIAPPLDLFGAQVLADPPALALTTLALGVATLPGAAAAVVAGVVFGAALSVKLTALTAIVVLVWLLGRRLVPALAGFAAFVAVLLLAHLHALGDLWTSGVTYHENARSTPAVIPHPHRQILDQIPHRTPFFVLAVLAVVVWVAFLVLRRPLGVWPLWSWVALALVFLLVHKPLHYNHLIEFPFTLAVASGATLAAAFERAPRPLLLVCALAVAAGYVQQLHRVDAARVAEPASNVAAARALARLVPPGALTVDDRPIVSFLARRQVVGQLVDLAFLRWQTGSLDDRRVVADLRPARAVVVSRALGHRPRVLAYVRRRFALRYHRGGVSIYVRR